MHQYIRLILCLTAIVTHDAAYATKLSHKEYERFSGGALHADSNELLHVRDEAGNPYLNMVRGLLNSYNGEIVHYITEIPCNIISILESDAGQAEQFVKQIEQGQVPTIISNLPQEAVNVFGDVLNVLELIPSDVIDVGQAAVTDVVSIVNDIEDGSITSVVASLPSEIAASITDRWGDYNDGITDAWNGWANGFKCNILNHCPSTPVQTCGTPLTTAATTTAAATPTNSTPAALSSSASMASTSSASSISSLNTLTAGQQSSMQSITQSPMPTSTQSTPQTSTQLSPASKSVEWAVGSLLSIAVVGILGVAVIL